MTPNELKRAYETKWPNRQYFSDKSMTNFGDTMENYGVRNSTSGLHWELYRKSPVTVFKSGRVTQDSVYFHKETLEPTIQP